MWPWGLVGGTQKAEGRDGHTLTREESRGGGWASGVPGEAWHCHRSGFRAEWVVAWEASTPTGVQRAQVWLPHGLITIRPACSPRARLLTGPLSVATSREATALPPPAPDHLLKHQPPWGDKPHWNTGKGLAFRKIRGLPSRR